MATWAKIRVPGEITKESREISVFSKRRKRRKSWRARLDSELLSPTEPTEATEQTELKAEPNRTGALRFTLRRASRVSCHRTHIYGVGLYPGFLYLLAVALYSLVRSFWHRAKFNSIYYYFPVDVKRRGNGVGTFSQRFRNALEIKETFRERCNNAVYSSKIHKSTVYDLNSEVSYPWTGKKETRIFEIATELDEILKSSSIHLVARNIYCAAGVALEINCHSKPTLLITAINWLL